MFEKPKLEKLPNDKEDEILENINEYIESLYLSDKLEELDKYLEEVYQKLDEMQRSRFSNTEKEIKISHTKTTHEKISGIFNLIELLFDSNQSGELNKYLEEIRDRLKRMLYDEPVKKKQNIAA
jgi:hypothetical protein